MSKLKIKKSISYIWEGLLLFIAAPFILVIMIIVSVLTCFLWPIEYLIYKKKYYYLGKYYPLKLYFEHLIIYFKNQLDLKDNNYVYNQNSRCFAIEDKKVIILFKISNRREIEKLVKTQDKFTKMILVKNKQDINKTICDLYF